MRIVLDHPRYKGEYEIVSARDFTNLEWRWVKKISGYMPNTIGDGWDGDDPDMWIAFAVVALHRAGRVSKDEALQAAASFDDLAGSSFVQVVGVEAATDDPPAEPATTPATETQNGNTGASSNTTSDSHPENAPSPTGARV